MRKALLAACKADPLFWIDGFVTQYNPNTIGEASAEIGPFITWDFQEDAVRRILGCMADGKDLVISKSREMGASWLCLLLADWYFLFHEWKKVLMISRSADAVDRPGDSDSLFWKIDFVHDHLPPWMREGRVDNVKTLMKMSYTNPLTHSTMTGQASTGKAGVGGRAHLMFIDEFSLIDEDYEVLNHTANTARCRIFNGTQRGTEKAFYQLSQRVDFRQLQMHWTQHPDKRKGLYRYLPEENRTELLSSDHYRVSIDEDQQPRLLWFPEEYPFIRSPLPLGGPFPGIRSPWYDDQCIRQGSPRAVAMNLDIDAAGSVTQVFDPLRIRKLIQQHALDPLWEGELDYDHDSAEPHGLQPLKGGRLKLWRLPIREGKMAPGRFGIAWDISTGSGCTPSCGSILDLDTGEKIGQWIDANIEPTPLAYYAVALARLFCTADGYGARLAWEVPGPGQTFGKRVVETIRYAYVYCRENEKKSWVVTKPDTPGWYNNGDTKRVLLEEYRAALDRGDFINHSKPALEDTLNFRYNKSGNPEHAAEEGGDNPADARTNHGDLVIADALVYRLRGKHVRRAAGEVVEEEAEVNSVAWRYQMAQLEAQLGDPRWRTGLRLRDTMRA